VPPRSLGSWSRYSRLRLARRSSSFCIAAMSSWLRSGWPPLAPGLFPDWPPRLGVDGEPPWDDSEPLSPDWFWLDSPEGEDVLDWSDSARACPSDDCLASI